MFVGYSDVMHSILYQLLRRCTSPKGFIPKVTVKRHVLIISYYIVPILSIPIWSINWGSSRVDCSGSGLTYPIRSTLMNWEVTKWEVDKVGKDEVKLTKRELKKWELTNWE